MIKKRRTYLPRIVGTKVMMPADANAWLRGEARGCDGGVCEELAAEVVQRD